MPNGKVITAQAQRSAPTTGQIAVIRLFDLLIAVRWPTALTLSVWLAIPYLAGRNTRAAFYVIFKQIGTFDAVPWVVVAMAVVWALLERQFRRRKTAYFTGRITALERQIDPARSSSGLTSTGDDSRS